MITQIIKIGNSKGVRVPKALLDEAKLTGYIEMYIDKGELRIKPAKSPTSKVNDEALMAEKVLSDWLNKDEDEAWVHLQ